MGNIKSETYKRIKGDKFRTLWVWICVCLNIIVDFNAFMVTVCCALPTSYAVLPIVAFVFDAVFLALAFGLNFRLKSSVTLPLLYFVLSVILGFCSLTYLSGNIVVVSTTATVLWLTFRIISCIAFLIACICAAGTNRLFKIITTVVAVLFFAYGVFYIVYVACCGYIGQWDFSSPYKFETRAIEYEYDEHTGTIKASAVLPGRGETVVIPSSFDGYTVSEVDMSMFTDADVKYVVLDCGEGVTFSGLASLVSHSYDYDIYVREDRADSFRDRYYALALANKNSNTTAAQQYLALANKIAPIVDEGEVYVSFSYTLDTLDIISGETLPIWIRPKGSVFSLSDSAYSDISFLKHGDETNESDLCWNYLYGDGNIFSDIQYSGVSVIGTRVSESKICEVSFSKVFAITVSEGNDTLYENDSFKSFTYNGLAQGCRYVSLNTADNLLEEYGTRDGFDLSWTITETDVYPNVVFNSASSLKSYLDIYSGSCATITPVWTMQAPTISSFTSNASNNTATYGDDVTLSWTARAAATYFNLTYAWSGDALSGTTYSSSCTLENVLPSQSGIITLSVTSSYTGSSLTSESTTSLYLTINKKELDFTWSLPTGGGLIYSGTAKTIEASYNTAQVINDDTISFTQNYNFVTDAGTYALSAALTGTCSSLYEAKGNTSSVTISPYTLTVTWSDMSVTYNGVAQSPTYSYSATAVGSDTISDDLLGTTNSWGSGYTNAGTYSVSLNKTNGNYTLSQSSSSFSIAQKELTISWESSASYTYNGANQYPTASITEGIENSESITLTYSGYGKDAASYTVTAAPSSDNYYISISNNTKSYTISPKTITLTWSGNGATETDGFLTFTYDGTTKILSAEATGLESGDSASFTYTGGQINANTDSGSYTTTVTIGNSNYTFENSSNTASCSFKIAPMDLTLTANDQTMTYSASVFPEANFSYSYTSLASTDSISQIISNVTYTGAATTAINVGTYAITLSYSNGSRASNYNITTQEGTLTISERVITFNWTGTNVTYNGAAQSPTLSVSNLASGELKDILGLLYTGSATDAGTYTYTATFTNTNYILSDSTRQESTSFTISKAALIVSWTNTSLTYSGSAQHPTASLSGTIWTESDKDNLDITYTGAETYVGTYTCSISISNNNYSLSGTTSQSYTISPKPIALTWSTETYTYNGSAQYPTATANNVVSGDTVEISYSGYGSSAGSYTVTASTSNSNYTFTNSTQTYSIGAKSLTVSWSNTNLTYNKTSQHPTATLNEIVSGDTVDITYSGSQTNVGTYTCSISISNSNYTLSGTTSQSYTISPKSITLTWSVGTYTYNGSSQRPTASYTSSDICSGDTVDISYSGAGTNAGTYSVTATSSNNNYIFTNATQSYTIDKASVMLTWSDTSFTYDGSSHCPTATISSGLISGERVTVSVSGAASSVGTHTATATLSSNNYTITNATQSFTITEVTVQGEA